MSWGWRPYVSAAEKRAKAGREMAKLAKRGIAVAPITIEGRAIARTFWGKAWCDNLEAYSDFSNRLPRGRTYVRNGSVLDLQVAAGQVTALVQGSSLYKITITIKPLGNSIWQTVQTRCSGKIQSLMELLQGRLSESVMQVVTHQNEGLFPKPNEIKMECSCPDWAGMCKHVAASLYGIGARLDAKPELLFLLRGVDPAELISQAAAAEVATVSPENALSSADLSDIFGIEVESDARPKAASDKETVQRKAAKSKPRPAAVAGPAGKPKTRSKKKPTSQAQRRSKPVVSS